MPHKEPYARIAITLPRAQLAAADQLARQQDRPRSWIIAEAIRQYSVGRNGSGAPPLSPETPTRGLGAQRRAQLVADLRLTPEERVRAAEETARVGELRDRVRVKRVLAFDRYEDYLAWKKLEAAGA